MRNTAFALIMLFSATALGSPVCFTDVTSYNRVKSQLPASLRNGSLYLAKDTSATAAITQRGGRFHFDMIYQFLGVTEDAGQIREICVSANQAVVKLASGAKKTLSISGNSFVYMSNRLNIISRSQHLSIRQSLQGRKGGSGSGTASRGQQ